MTNDSKKSQRCISVYSIEPGNRNILFKFHLKPVSLSFLQKIFNIDPNDPDPVTRDMAYCYKINKNQAKLLQPFVIDGDIDVEKYEFTLESYASDQSEDELAIDLDKENKLLESLDTLSEEGVIEYLPRWELPDGRILEWNYEGGYVDMYSAQGEHLGAYNHETGEQLKEADPYKSIKEYL